MADAVDVLPKGAQDGGSKLCIPPSLRRWRSMETAHIDPLPIRCVALSDMVEFSEYEVTACGMEMMIAFTSAKRSLVKITKPTKYGWVADIPAGAFSL